MNSQRDAARVERRLCESENETGQGLEGDKAMTKREKEGEMNEEGAVGAWAE